MIQIENIVRFYTFEFWCFLLLSFFSYWRCPHSWRNRLLLLCSYTFYASWHYQFLGLVLLSTFTDYFCGLSMERFPKRKKLFLTLSLITNLTVLGIFKYADFFANGLVLLAQTVGINIKLESLNLILPLGISFYTFQSIAYTLDVYRGKLPAEKNFWNFAVFVAFFPQLIAGPIARATHQIPQLVRFKTWQEIEFSAAFYLFIYGLFKKRVLADSLETIVRVAYDNPNTTGVSIFMGFIAFTIQSYCDLSGYSDMARGSALLFGIKLTQNCNFPLFATNPPEFWNRWHISLSQWVKHYVYIPLLTRIRRPVLTIFLAFIIMGIWHGPKWHFIYWGIYWASLVVVYQGWKKTNFCYLFSFLKKAPFAHLAMGIFIVIGQSFLHANSSTHYFSLWMNAFQNFMIQNALSPVYGRMYFSLLLLLSYELIIYRKRDELFISRCNFYAQATFYCVLYFLYRNMGTAASIDFLYFQF